MTTGTNKITTGEVTKLMATATKSSKAMREDVQAALVAMVRHSTEHNDTSLTCKQGAAWVKGLEGVRGKAVIDFLIKFGGVYVKGQEFANSKKNKPDLMGAMGCKWWTLVPENAFAGFDLAAALQSVLKKIENARAEADQSGVYIAPKVTAQLAALQADAKMFTDAQKAAKASAKAAQDETDLSDMDAVTSQPEELNELPATA